MTEILCVWCYPDEKTGDEKTDGLCPAHFNEFLAELKAEGYDVDPELPVSKNLDIGSGDCLICGIACTSSSYCYGCKEFICGVCVDTPEFVMGKHTKEAHYKAMRITQVN